MGAGAGAGGGENGGEGEAAAGRPPGLSLQVPEARAAAGPAAPHSRSVDDARPAPRRAPRPAPRSCPLRRALDAGPRRSVNSRSLDLLGEDHHPEEFVV